MHIQTVIVGWADMDFNAHMRNTAYLDKAADARMLFFADRGFPVSEFWRQGLGPVVMKDEIDYVRERHLLDKLEMTLSLVGLAEDGSRMRIRNEFFRPTNKLAARVMSTLGWLALNSRRLVCPPAALLIAVNSLAAATTSNCCPAAHHLECVGVPKGTSPG